MENVDHFVSASASMCHVRITECDDIHNHNSSTVYTRMYKWIAVSVFDQAVEGGN